MRPYLSALLVAALPCLAAGQSPDVEAQAALALSVALAGHQDAPAVKPAVCPCSQTGTCRCTPGDQCEALCYKLGAYRWVVTANPNQTALYRGAEQLGNYWHAEKEYRRLIDRPGEPDVWTVEACPVTPPARPVTKAIVLPATSFVPQYRQSFAPAPSFSGGRGGSC